MTKIFQINLRNRTQFDGKISNLENELLTVRSVIMLEYFNYSYYYYKTGQTLICSSTGKKDRRQVSVGLNPYMLYFSSRWHRARELDEEKYTQRQTQTQAPPTRAHTHAQTHTHPSLPHTWDGSVNVNGKGFKLSEYESITEQIENVYDIVRRKQTKKKTTKEWKKKKTKSCKIS